MGVKIIAEPIESGADKLHTWWELSYSSYLVIPRSLMQSMPDEWQRRMAELLDEGHEIIHKHGVEWPPKDHSIAVQLRHDPSGHFVSDDLADYQRGLRRLWKNDGSTSSDQTQ
jgi:hypothetical protein